jgi:hypothetical protein
MEVEDGILYHIWVPPDRRLKEEIRKQVVLPLAWKYKVLEKCHDSSLTGGHLEFTKTYNKIRERYWFLNMYSETQKWIDICTICGQKKGLKPKMVGLLQSIVAKEVFAIIGIYFFGLLPTTKQGNTLILFFTDHFTKWVELFPVQRENEKEVASSRWNYWAAWGNKTTDI